MASLVGRGRIVSNDRQLKSSVEYVKEDRDGQWIALEQEEKMRKAKLAEEEKAEEEEEARDESGDDEESEDEGKDEKKDGKENK